ncbi:MAG: hypothetical protein WBD40_22005 [Tepidisphaeraceae bacterium]
MLGWFVVGPQTAQFVQKQWRTWNARREARKEEAKLLAWQQQCLTHAFPSDTVVYTEDLARAKTLLQPGSAYQSVRAIRARVPEWSAPIWLPPPAHWAAFNSPTAITHGLEVLDEGALLFTHDRRTPRGERRLVVVELNASQKFNSHEENEDQVSTMRQLIARAYVPFAPGAEGKIVARAYVMLTLPGRDRTIVSRAADGSFTTQRGRALTLFAGQADPEDPSHFTIPYEIDGQSGMIDGWIRDDNLLLTPRTGIPKPEGNLQRWELGTSSTTAPSTTRSARP